MSKLQLVSNDYESVSLYTKRAMNLENPTTQTVFDKYGPSDYDPDLARAIVTSVNGAVLGLRCFFFTPKTGRVLTIGNLGTRTFTISSGPTAVTNGFVSTMTITLATALAGVTVGTVITYDMDDTNDILDSDTVPNPLPLVYGMVSRGQNLRWTSTGLIGANSLNADTLVNFVFAVPEDENVVEGDVTLTNITSTSFDTPELPTQSYHQNPQFFYSVEGA